MKRNLKKYIVNADESDLFAVSIVDAPAVDSEFIALAKQEPLYFKDDEKHMVYGCALRTDFPIYRNSEEYGEYYLEFSKDAVEKMMRRFMKNGYQNNFTEQHQRNTDGITITESWIKTDEFKDKSNALGIGNDCAVGSWFIGAYVDSNDVWQKIKNGEYKGFSVEALCSLDEINFNKQDIVMNDDETFWNRMKGLMKEIFSNIDENKAPESDITTPPDTLPTDDEITPQTQEKQPSDESQARNDNNASGEDDEISQQPSDESKELGNLDELVKNLQDELKALKEANQELQDKVKELGKRPSAKPVNTKPSSPNPNDTYKQWREQMRNYIS